jgi:hypothetical protein
VQLEGKKLILLFTYVEVQSNHCNPGARGRGRIVCFGFARCSLLVITFVDAVFRAQYFYLFLSLLLFLLVISKTVQKIYGNVSAESMPILHP